MNQNLQLLRILYSSASAKYLKLKARLDKATKSGRFYKLSKRKQSTVINRIKALYTRLKSLQTQLRLAGAGAAFALILSAASPAKAQNSLGPFERNDPENPLPPPIVVRTPQPSVVDIDNDGDLDLFVGNRNGRIEFFRNDSPLNTVRRFNEVRGNANPLYGVNLGYDAAIAFTDADGDGDFDALLGNQYGFTFYYRNTGSKTNPVFTEQTGSSNPFDGIEGTVAGSSNYNPGAIPTFVDLDKDGDQDLVIGSSYINFDGTPKSGIKFYRNTGGNFTYIDDNTLSEALFFDDNITTTFADIDGDGDLDAFIGSQGYGPVKCYVQLNEGVFEPNEGPWNAITKEGNPFSEFTFSKYSAPVAADFDKDGDLDFLVGTQQASCFDCAENTNLRYFENTDGNFTLSEITQLHSSPTAGVDVKDWAKPSFSDIDGDGDLDAILGSKYTTPDIHIYVNTDGKFLPQPNHPLIEVIEEIDITSVHREVTPVFADIDNDQDQDIFICFDGSIRFLRNNEGTFTNEGDPFNIAPFSVWGLTLALVDMDSDGDLDALVSQYVYEVGMGLYYFENTSSGTSVTFTPATAPAPFDQPGYFDYLPKISSVDIDHDGDQDIVGSEFYYGAGYSYGRRIILFANNGDKTFTKVEEPLANSQEYYIGLTTFLDIDGDGDLDGFSGESDGTIIFFENTNPPPVTNIANSALIVVGGEPTILDPTLTIVDSDNDDIVNAVVTIGDYVAGDEELSFDAEIAQANGITGSFDGEAGALTFSGRATIDVYQNLLRSVSINFTGVVPAGRKSSAAGKVKGSADLAQQVTFQVRDTDFTLTTVSVVSLAINIVSSASEIEIFNALSPADQDRNQFFEIRNIETVSPENKVTIYNRWGDIVFEVMNYNNTLADKRFNGTSDKGKELPTGTYFYKIEAGTKTHTGYLSLKR